MKLVKCIIRPNKVDEVREALEKASVAGMTITEVRGHGRQKGHKAVYRGREYDVSLLPKTMIEMAVPDDLVDEVIAIILKGARTGDIGDGRIWVLSIEEAYNIRTAARDL
ncbi:MAG TPA: P-II family nitrogen regulator [Vicinamibacterales bacterium]